MPWRHAACVSQAARPASCVSPRRTPSPPKRGRGEKKSRSRCESWVPAGGGSPPGACLMRRRQGFTLVEMMVALALTVFIMVILSEAFVTGLETFRQLKAIGDMEESL